MDPHRAERVSEALREELSEIIGYEMSDPRVAQVVVSEVQVDPGLRQAHVRVQVNGGEKEARESLEALENARHFLRRELAGRLSLYRVPEIHFEADRGPQASARIEQLLKRAKKGRPKTDS